MVRVTESVFSVDQLASNGPWFGSAQSRTPDRRPLVKRMITGGPGGDVVGVVLGVESVGRVVAVVPVVDTVEI